MPVILLDRLPLPSLKVYTTVSVLLLSASVYYAIQVTSDQNWKINFSNSQSQSENSVFKIIWGGSQQTNVEPPKLNITAKNDTRSIKNHFAEVVTFMIQEPHCIWVSNFSKYTLIYE